MLLMATTAQEFRQKIATATLMGLSVLLLALFAFTYSGVYLLGSGGAALLWIIFTFINWRCANCETLLPVAGSSTDCERCSRIRAEPGKDGR
jgi:hypothetical protein